MSAWTSKRAYKSRERNKEKYKCPHSFVWMLYPFLSFYQQKKQKKSQSDRRAESTGVMMTMVMEKERERKVWAQGQVVHG